MNFLTRLKKYNLKLKTKPWITPAIPKSILIKNNLFQKYTRLSDPLIKQEVHFKYKCYRNLLSTILKESKQSYYGNFFQTNLNDIKNIWKGIRNLISLKQSPKSNIHLLSHNNETKTDPKNIANIFNDYFISIAEKAKTKIKFSNKSFTGFLYYSIDNSFFIKATNSDEFKNII